MKILFLTPDYPPNIYAGIGVYVEELVSSLLKSRSNIEITVVLLRCDGFVSPTLVQYEYPKNVKVLRYDVSKIQKERYADKKLHYYSFQWAKNNIDTLESILDFIGQDKYDIVHMHDFYLAWIMDGICRIQGLPLVTTIHSDSCLRKTIEDAVKGHIWRNSDSVVAVSKYLKNKMDVHYGVRPDVEVVYAGISPGHPTTTQKEHIITYVGRLSEAKGVDVLIRAFHHYVNGQHDSLLKLHIMGDGVERAALQKLSEALDISKQVIFHGHVQHNEARERMSKAKLHVVPSRRESFGLTGLEAMSEGTCVICSGVGGMVEYVKDGENGLLVPPDDVIALSKSMAFLLDANNKELYDKMVREGFGSAQLFSWDKTADQYLDIYKNTICRYQERKLNNWEDDL